jgi:hypothetical protein
MWENIFGGDRFQDNIWPIKSNRNDLASIRILHPFIMSHDFRYKLIKQTVLHVAKK